MRYWAVFFFILAIIAALFGFVFTTAATGIGKVLFFVFLALFILCLVAGLARDRIPKPPE